MEDVVENNQGDLGKLEQTVHGMVTSLVIMRALALPHGVINEAQLIDNYISLYAVRRAMAKAVQDGMYMENDKDDKGGWIFNEGWKSMS